MLKTTAVFSIMHFLNVLKILGNPRFVGDGTAQMRHLGLIQSLIGMEFKDWLKKLESGL